MVIVLRIVLIGLFIFFIYTAFKYILNPKRKLDLSQEQKRYYLLDNREHVQKNMQLTYKGALFEGEKYLGTTEQSFEVISIFIWCKKEEQLQGLQ
ncbi:sigma-w pathway protein ysdB [Bacillus carboniphilus]|uniref:sigma-w pathway protein ysdB n=1 Tax=Bacillus carboniphilus TaxID=86663 RepID=UPI003531CEFB